MAQFARPDADNSLGLWVDSAGGTTNIYTNIDETSASDTDWIHSDTNTSPDVIELGLTTITDPASSSGHVVRWRWVKIDTTPTPATGGHNISMVMRLMQGVTTICTDTITHPTSDSATWATKTYNLTTGEADSITDYADLRIQFERNGTTGGGPTGRRGLGISWAELEVPDAPAGPSIPIVMYHNQFH